MIELGLMMNQPTSLLQPYTASIDQQAKLELDEENSTLLPGDYVYLLAHIPPGASLVKPFYSSDSGPMQLLGSVVLERSQAGLVLNDTTRSINLEYFPKFTPWEVFFGNEISLDLGKLRSGIVVPSDDYDGKEVYQFNIYYQVEFHRIRYRPNHPGLIHQDYGGIAFEEYRGSGELSTWPFNVQVFWQ